MKVLCNTCDKYFAVFLFESAAFHTKGAVKRFASAKISHHKFTVYFEQINPSVNELDLTSIFWYVTEVPDDLSHKHGAYLASEEYIVDLQNDKQF